MTKSEIYTSLFEKVERSYGENMEKVSCLHGYIKSNFTCSEPDSLIIEKKAMSEYQSFQEKIAEVVAAFIVNNVCAGRNTENPVVVYSDNGEEVLKNAITEKRRIKLYVDPNQNLGAALSEEYVGLDDPDYEWAQCVLLFQINGNEATNIAFCSNAGNDVREFKTIFEKEAVCLNNQGVNDFIGAVAENYIIR